MACETSATRFQIEGVTLCRRMELRLRLLGQLELLSYQVPEDVRSLECYNHSIPS
jgi:hypothetical protein